MRPWIPVALVAAALVTVTLLAGPASAQEAGSKATRDYVQAAGQSDAFEMLEAQTALTQSRDPQVRAYAQGMLADHGRTSQALQQATATSGLTPPPMGVGADQAPLLGALQGLRGLEFDQAYWRHQMLGHRSALTTAQMYAASGDDAAVRQAAQAAVPIIQAHLQQAKKMAAASGDS